jgi:lipopolysaccharide transport system ATP-binding protein
LNVREEVLPMFSEIALRAEGLGKTYHLYARPIDRLKQLFAPQSKSYYREFAAVEQVAFDLQKGEVLGVIGTNGSGKSTLLQLICGVLEPTAGSVEVTGRIAALLELGAGFNPEFTGRENIYLNATILGLSAAEIESKIEGIIDFSGVRDFIDQPVKTYSSGMYVRLAFSIATSVEPDILVIDEALSVGDGAFARKSFDRIMQLKERGATILFCSHNIYQVEALCQRVLWLDKGKVRAFGQAAAVCQQYNQFLEQDTAAPSGLLGEAPADAPAVVLDGSARIVKVEVLADGNAVEPLQVHSMVSTLEVKVAFGGSPVLPPPSVAVIITDASGRNITSCSTHYDKLTLQRDAQGAGHVSVAFPKVHLLRGVYVVHVFLMCEQAIHIYDSARCAEFSVVQPGLEIGIVALQRHWSQA